MSTVDADLEIAGGSADADHALTGALEPGPV